ncbi:MAG: hypothetical protein FJ271_22150 [Planctomycetes bacterium]|nr:hypothetical protein [Planctomycetota bacterium]
MRFTVYHCHDPACGHRVWVPLDQRGKSGKCPQCGAAMHIPADLPEDQSFEGPDIFQGLDERPLTCATSED